MRLPKWLFTVLPLAGLGVLPLAGLVYVAVAPSSPNPTGATSTPSNTTAVIRASDLPDSPFVSHPMETPPPRPTSFVAGAMNHAAFAAPATAVQRDAAKHLCCEKLTDLAQAAEVSVRATFQAASAACNGAPTNDDAYRQVASIIEGSAAAVPSECRKR
jgi:hypothetical protein